MYGCRDSGSIWEEVYSQALKDMGFVQGTGSPCCFFHPQWALACVVHGDDFTCLGTDDSLDLYESAMKRAFDIKLKGRLGHDKNDERDMRVLNRIVRVVDEGLLYEPDPRHVEYLLRDLGLSMKDNSRACPGRKPEYNPDIHPEPIEPFESIEDVISSVRRAVKTSLTVRFDDAVTYRFRDQHPHDHLWSKRLTGPLFSSQSIAVPHGHDRFAGISPAELADRYKE